MKVPMLWKYEDAKERLKPNFAMALACIHNLFDQLEKNNMVETADKVVELGLVTKP